MEWNKTFRMIVMIVTVSTLTPVESVPRHLLHVFPPSNPPSESESPINSPATSPETPASSITNSPATSPQAPASSITNSPATSPQAPASSITNSPATSPEAPATSPQPLLSPEIKSICGKTEDPTLCESSVSPLLTTKPSDDASSVLVLAIQASIAATKAAISTVKRVAGADCQELYDTAVSDLEDAVSAVKEGDVGTVNVNLSAAMTDYVTCNDGFEEAGEVNPLVDVADRLTKMVSNCLAISTLIKK